MKMIRLYNQKGISKTNPVPSLAEVCKMPLPGEAVLLGIGVDDNPVLYNPTDTSAPNIVIWDRVIGQGLRVLKTAIEYIVKYKTNHKSKKTNRTEFVVISNNVEEWEALTENRLGIWDKDACVAIVPFFDNVCNQVLKGLSGWVYKEKEAGRPVFLFIDGLENVLDLDGDSQHNLNYIMSYGAMKGIHVIATARSQNRAKLSSLLDGFQCEMYGKADLEFFEYMEGRVSGVPGIVVFWTPETEM